MQQRPLPAADPDIWAWHRLVDALAAEIDLGDPKALIARVTARLEADSLAPYLPAMFSDPD